MSTTPPSRRAKPSQIPAKSQVPLWTRGEGGAAPLEEFVWQVSEWRDGRVVRWQMYESEQDAIEAAGLRE